MTRRHRTPRRPLETLEGVATSLSLRVEALAFCLDVKGKEELCRLENLRSPGQQTEKCARIYVWACSQQQSLY